MNTDILNAVQPLKAQLIALRNENERLKAIVEDLAGRVSVLEAKRKPGRPKKDAA